MDGKGVSFEVWGWLIETEIENPRERGGTSHGEGMMMEIVHFLMPSFSLSLWLLCLIQEQCKHLSWNGMGREDKEKEGVVFWSVCINNAYHYKLLCNFMLFCHCPVSKFISPMDTHTSSLTSNIAFHFFIPFFDPFDCTSYIFIQREPLL